MGSQCAKPKSKGMIHSRKTKVGVSPLLAQKNANKSLSFCEPSNLLNSKMPSLENVPNIESLDTLSVRSKSLTTECAYEESPKLIAFGSPAKPNTLPIFDDTEIRNTAQYKKGPLVGKGCYGEVYECLNLSSGELHAAKSVKAYGNMGKFYNYIEAIRKEITVLKTLCHPNVVKYFAMDISEVKEDNYTIIDIISEYVSGGSIKVLLDKFDKLDERVISHYTKQILEGLAYLHSNDIVHRNIKSSNVLIDACGTAKLADFGCFKNLDKFVCTNSPEKNNIYHLSAKLKFCWEAPEVLLKKSQGKSADIWSVGCVVLEMLTGLPPWKVVDSNLANVFKMISLGELPDLPENISDNCRDFLLKVFKFKAEERPSAVELLDHPFIREQIPSISCLDYESMHTFQIHQTLMGATSLDFLQDEIFAGEKRHQENKYNRCEDPSINVHCTEQPHIKKINELSIHVGQSKAIPNHLNKPAPALPGLMRFGSKTSIEDPKESKSTAVPSLMRFGSRTSIEDVKEMKNNWETAKTPGRRNETEFDYGTCNSLSTASKTMISEETTKIGSQTSIIQTPIKNTFFFSPNVTIQEKNQSGKKVENNHTITPSSFHNSRAGIEKEKIIWDRETHNSPKDQKDLRKKLEEDMIKELAEIDMDAQNHEEKLESELQREISSPRTLEQEKNEMRKRFEQEMEQELNGVEISQFDR